MPTLRTAAVACIAAGIAAWGAVYAAADVSARPASSPFVSGSVFLTAVSFANGSDGWAAGYAVRNGYETGNAYVFRTTNGGATWTHIHVGWHVDQMQFVSSTSGWAIVESPANCNTGQCAFAIVHTNNAGNSWALQLNGGRCHQIQSMDFITASEGWAIESTAPCQTSTQTVKTRLVTTNNGGRSWTIAFQPGSVLSSVHFGTPLNGWAAADGLNGSNHSSCRTTLFEKTSMAQTWQAQRRISGYCDGLVDFVDGRFGWLEVTNVAACAEAGCVDNRLYRTTDGGNTWTIQRRGTVGGCGFLLTPHFVNDNTGYLPVSKGAGNCRAGGVEITHDGGAHWFWKMPQGMQVSDLSPVDASNVWGVGCSQTVQSCTHLVHTTDGGMHWTKLHIG